MTAKYFDAHCHVQFDAFDADRAEIISKMQQEGVTGIVVGCDAKSSRAAVDLADQHEHLYSSVGLHPNRLETEEYDEHLLRNLMMSEKVVAVGECGLDYYRPKEVNDAVKNKQKEVLKRHVRLAGSTDRALIVHARPSKGTYDAYEDALAILQEAKKEFPNLRGDMHFFVGSLELAKAFGALSFTVSFTAVITFARDYDQIIRELPLEMILSETDSPYVPPTSRARGSRNDPFAVKDVVAKIAEIRGEDSEAVRAAILGNAARIFRLPNLEMR